MRWVAQAACLLFFALGVFFIWHSGQAVWALWHEGAQVIQKSGLDQEARNAYERMRRELGQQQESARVYLVQMENDIQIKRAQLTQFTMEMQKARKERDEFEKEAREKGLVKGADGRWAPSSQWSVKQWWDSFWQNVDEVNRRWAKVKQTAELATQVLNEAQEKMNAAAGLLARQEIEVDRLRGEMQKLGDWDGFEKRFREEWEREGISKALKQARLNERASRAGLRVMAILHFTTGLLAILLGLRSLARVLQLRGWCEQKSLDAKTALAKPWGSGGVHAG